MPYKDKTSAKARACASACYKRWRLKNLDHEREMDRRWVDANRAKKYAMCKATTKAWQKRNKDRERIRHRRQKKESAKHLTNGYVAHQLGLNLTECPKILLEVKRAQIMLLLRAAKGKS